MELRFYERYSIFPRGIPRYRDMPFAGINRCDEAPFLVFQHSILSSQPLYEASGFCQLGGQGLILSGNLAQSVVFRLETSYRLAATQMRIVRLFFFDLSPDSSVSSVLARSSHLQYLLAPLVGTVCAVICAVGPSVRIHRPTPIGGFIPSHL